VPPNIIQSSPITTQLQPDRGVGAIPRYAAHASGKGTHAMLGQKHGLAHLLPAIAVMLQLEVQVHADEWHAPADPSSTSNETLELFW
jgi:hypothetical protein